MSPTSRPGGSSAQSDATIPIAGSPCLEIGPSPGSIVTGVPSTLWPDWSAWAGSVRARMASRVESAAATIDPPSSCTRPQAGSSRRLEQTLTPVGIEVHRLHRVGKVEVRAARARRVDRFPEGPADVQVDEGSARHVDGFGEGQTDGDGLARRVGVAVCGRGGDGYAADARVPVNLVRRLVPHFGVVHRHRRVVGGCRDGSAVEGDASAIAVQARVRAQAHAVGVQISALDRVGEFEVRRARARCVPGPAHFVADFQPHRRRVVGLRDVYRFVVADPDPDRLSKGIASRRVAWRGPDRDTCELRVLYREDWREAVEGIAPIWCR